MESLQQPKQKGAVGWMQRTPWVTGGHKLVSIILPREARKARMLGRREGVAIGDTCSLHPSGKGPVHMLHWDKEDRKLSSECVPWSVPAHRQDLLFDSSVQL